MIAIWGNKEHLTCVFPLFSHDGPKSFKTSQTLKNPLTPIGSCRDLHIFEHVYNTSGHIYENLTKIPKSNISNILVNSTKKRWSGRASSLFSFFSLLSFREMCAPLARNHTFLQKHRKPHAWIREQLSKSAHLPDPTHAGTKYPRSGEPLTPIYDTIRYHSHRT